MMMTQKKWSKAFEITSVCRLDLKDKFNDVDVAKFTDDDMVRLASKMADAYLDNGFWEDMQIEAQEILDQKEGEEK
jgi:hypothetical protein